MAHPYVRMRHQSAAPCPACGKHFLSREDRQKYCSVPCSIMGRRKLEDKTCVKCKVTKPWSEFRTRQHSRNTPTSCVDCYVPRKSVLAKPKPIEAKTPCVWCKKRFRIAASPSAVSRRKFCSKPCSDNAKRNNDRTCQVCARQFHYTKFAYIPSAKGRQKTCVYCAQERNRLREEGLGFMQTQGRMRQMARNTAAKTGVPYTLTREHEDAMYKSPCVLCGAPGCVLRRFYPELGFLPESVEILCWLCGQFGTTKTAVLTDEVIIKHARAIVQWADA